MKKNTAYTIGAVIVLLICAFCFVALPAITSSPSQGSIPVFGSYNGREIKYEQDSDLFSVIAQDMKIYEYQNVQITPKIHKSTFQEAFQTIALKYAYEDFVSSTGYIVPNSVLTKRLIDEYDYTQDKIAEKISKSRVYVTNSLRLLRLCDRVREMVVQGLISTGHARALIPVEDPALQQELAQKVFDEELSVRATEKLVKNLGKTKPKKTKSNNSQSLDAVYGQLSEKCKQAIGTKVDIISKGDGTGKIEIEFYSSDDLEKITDRLCRE